MGTKSNRSSGTQFTPKGINQGTVLVDPKTGNPINTVDGKLDVNASVTATIGDIEIDAATSSVRVEDPNTGAHIRVETDGSVNANVKVDSADGDNIAIKAGGNTMAVNPDGSTNVRMTNTLITTPFDYVGASYPSSTVEVYTYKSGGAGGSIVGVVTVAYTDSTKETITSVAKT